MTFVIRSIDPLARTPRRSAGPLARTPRRLAGPLATHSLAVLLAISGCGARSPIAAPLPEPPPQALDVPAQLAPGEQTTWDVYLQGMPIGSAVLAIDASVARTTFHTSRLAGALRAV